MIRSPEELDHRSRWMTPKSERLRAGYGSLLMQIPDGGCPFGKRCFLKAGHRGECYPKDGRDDG